MKNTYIITTILEKYSLFRIIVNLLYTVVLVVLTKIVTEVTMQKFMRNPIFTNKKRKYRIKQTVFCQIKYKKSVFLTIFPKIIPNL